MLGCPRETFPFPEALRAPSALGLEPQAPAQGE